MKKFLFIGVMAFLLCGCGKSETFTCNADGQDAVFTLKNGIVTSYTLGGIKASQSEIDEINGEYFTSATNNEEGEEALNRYVVSIGGSCN